MSPGQINVKPVTGMTPARIATELRVLIRDNIWLRIKNTGQHQAGLTPGQVDANKTHWHNNRQGVETLLMELAADLADLEDLAKGRRPSETKARLVHVRERVRSLHRSHEQERIYANWAFETLRSKPPPVDPELLWYAERAYALVQALPTTENPTNGSAENTLRAITAMIKVYHGLDLGKTVKDLPDVMSVLLAEVERIKTTEAAESEAQEMIAAAKKTIGEVPHTPIVFTNLSTGG